MNAGTAILFWLALPVALYASIWAYADMKARR